MALRQTGNSDTLPRNSNEESANAVIDQNINKLAGITSALTDLQLHRPFLKWAGGKYRVIKHIIPHLSPANRLIEPFVGAGSVFLNTNYKSYLLCDINPDLINLYQTLQSEGQRYISDAKGLFQTKHNTEKSYYQFRKRFNLSEDIYEKSLLFLYLNRHGYNGLCRYSKRSGFNVPFGRYTQPYFPENELLHFYQKSERATFLCGDFSKAMNRARRGNVVYCDPPYVPLSKTARFTQYAQHGFDLPEQQALAIKANHLANRGIKVLISNHDTPVTRQLYASAKARDFFGVQRNISRDAQSRNAVKEVIAIFSP